MEKTQEQSNEKKTNNFITSPPTNNKIIPIDHNTPQPHKIFNHSKNSFSHVKPSYSSSFTFNNNNVNLNGKIIKLFLFSNSSTKLNSDTSHVNFQFYQSITCDYNYSLLIAVSNFSIPCSFYNINSYNNTLYLNINGIVTSFTLTVGNYSAYSLLSLLNSTLLSNSITVTYNSTTNKYTFSTVATPIQFLYASSTCEVLLGFSSDSAYSTSITSDNVIDLTYTKCLYIVTDNLIFDNLDSLSGNKKSNILCSIIKNVNQGELITFQPSSLDYIPIYNKNINYMEIEIQDDSGRIIQMNNINWDLTLNVKFLQS